MMINRLVIDIDCTSFNTIKAIVQIYDELHCTDSNYKKIDWSEVHTYGFDELSCAKHTEINDYFETDKLFELLEPIENFDEVILRLKDRYENIEFCSMGFEKNLQNKARMISERYPYATFTGVNIAEYSDKSCIDMTDAIFIDDLPKNLKNSNAAVKILYGDEEEWNKDWNGIRCHNWYEVENYLKGLNNKEAL